LNKQRTELQFSIAVFVFKDDFFCPCGFELVTLTVDDLKTIAEACVFEAEISRFCQRYFGRPFVCK